QPTKPGTAPAPTLGAPPKAAPAKSGTVPAPAVRSSPTQPRPAPAPVTAPAPVPAAKVRPPAPDEVEVELVTELVPAPAASTSAMASPIARLPERRLWPPDRRDWIMLAIGAAGVLSAVGLGYAMAKVLRRKDTSE
ncbi:MAG: hypothetical protein L0241_07240, partial [Planctomycetia bacterium]|nr:hypothetical protein [Planctomycetia bacterium]